MAFDFAFWKQSEGQLFDGIFPLGRCISGGRHGAVFETQFQNRPAVIKIVPGTAEATKALHETWINAAPLSHPALIAIHAHGETELEGAHAAYLVTEPTDDNLGDLLAERPLTPAETRDMLAPLLSALGYLHAQGFAHGGITPANIMASGDQLKIASDGLMPNGDTAADCRAVGTLLTTALGLQRGARLPEPFAEIVRHCSSPDPAALWDVPQIEACLRGERAPEETAHGASAPSRTIWWAAAAAAVVAFTVFAFWPSRPTTAPNAEVETPAPSAVAAPAPAAIPSDKPSAFPAPPGTRRAAAPEPVTPNGVTKVLPDIPDAARRTISGRVRVNVRVRVKSDGTVEKATLERPRASKYLSGRALTAAQAWKFPPGNGTKDWMVRFELTRQETLASAVPLSN